MHEIDLTPPGYRNQRLVMRWLRYGAVGAVLIVTLSLGATGYLYLLQRGIESEIRQLQVKKDISNQQRNELTRLQASRDQLDKQWQLLASLRRGSAIDTLFRSIDGALTGNDIWFTDWKFKRSGTLAGKTAERESGTAGYFIVVPDADGSGGGKSWRIDTQMTIRGEALDYSALSGFVARLLDRPEIADVRILRSILKKQQHNRLVEFNLAVAVANGLGRG